MALWAELHQYLLERILKRVTRHPDVIQFGLVCKSWLGVAYDGYTRFPVQLPLSFCFPKPNLSPILMLPLKDGLEYYNFWSPTQCQVSGYLSLPETRGKWPCASSFGWVVMVDFEAPEEVLFFNPITQARIQLPPLSTFPVHQWCRYSDTRQFFFIKRAVLSTDPTKDPGNWILMAVVSSVQVLCYYRPGEDKWTLVDENPPK